MSADAPPRVADVQDRGGARVGWGPVAIAIMCVVYAVQFSLWSINRYENFLARRFDLGNMVQAVWSAAHGDLLLTSTDQLGEQTSRFAGHFEPILILFAPLWWVWPSPNMLVVVQAVCVATAAVPAYLLGRLWIGDERIAVAFGAVTLMYPFIQSQTLFDFHAVALATPLLLWAIWAAATNHNVALGLTVVLALMSKEQVGLAVFVFGIWIAFGLGRRRAGAIVAACGLAWSGVALGVIIPHFRTVATELALQSRYDAFGDSLPSAVINLVIHPIRSAELLLTADHMVYLLALLVPLLFLPLRAPLLALAALPDVMINVMSSHVQQQQLAYHYGAVIAPFLIAAAIRGLGSLRRSDGDLGRLARRPAPVLGTLIGVTLVVSFIASPLPFWGDPPLGRTGGVTRNRATAFTTDDPRAPIMARAIRLIPDDAVVSAGNGFGGHLSARRRILTFPAIDGAAWVVVDMELAAMGDGRDPPAHRERVDRLLHDPRSRLVFDEDGVLVIRRSAPG